ncbi:putative inositol-3-phosphate synthase [Iris pallida]|uniref:Inositol-3-phosphate synthase n=1 Tax=Iris pallida TaxID=29817 RepID=A0AAX6F9B7_IRIPA|nr:putative inositol-3-phosphate synthase [Iris pallida]
MEPFSKISSSQNFPLFFSTFHFVPLKTSPLLLERSLQPHHPTFAPFPAPTVVCPNENPSAPIISMHNYSLKRKKASKCHKAPIESLLLGGTR